MVKKRGREYGPYVYESYRDVEGNVKKRYMGKQKSFNFSWKIFIIFLISFIFVLAIYVLSSDLKIVEQPAKAIGNLKDASLNSLQKFINQINSAFLPKLTGRAGLDIEKIFSLDNYLSGILKIKVKTGELVPKDSKIVVEQFGNIMEYKIPDLISINANGKYYVENKEISGEGEGYGFPSFRVIYPDVNFVLKVFGQEEITAEETAESSQLTAGVIQESVELVNSIVNKNKQFSYNLETGKIAEIVQGSVISENETLPESELDLNFQDNKVVVSTEYSKTEEGFGAEFLEDKENILEISLSDLKIPVKNGTLKISLVYNNIVLAESMKKISTSGEIVDLTQENETKKIIKNITYENGTLIKTKQYKAVINKPVKWIKTISIINATQNLEIELPKEAKNISIITGSEIDEAEKTAKQEEKTIEEDKNSLISGKVSLEIVEDEGIISKIMRWISLRLTGNVVSEEDVQNSITETEDNKLVDVSSVAESTGATEIAVEYETPAPTAEEKEIPNGKRVIVSADSELGYTDILAYSELDNKIKLENKEKIKIYHIVNETRELVTFDAYDLDEDGNIDYVEWIVPHLSSQVYEIIYITKAEHLDSERNFVEDIYDLVKEKDGIYAEINNNEYVRVTFEQALDKTKDITIYARAVSNNPQINVYKENDDKLITSFNNISSENWYKVYLTNLADGESYATFDLKVLGQVEIDYIVDPQANLSDVVYQCGTIDSAGTYTLNQSVNSSGTCITINVDDVTLDGNGENIIFNGVPDDSQYGILISGARTNITIKNFAGINDSDTSGTNGDNSGIIADNNLTNSQN